MTKPNERPGWMPYKKEKGIPPVEYAPLDKIRIWNKALDAVLKAADEHGIVFVEKEAITILRDEILVLKESVLKGQYDTRSNVGDAVINMEAAMRIITGTNPTQEVE